MIIKLGDLVKNITFLTVVLYSASLFRLKVYYNQFHVDIIPFLTFSEAVKSVFSGRLINFIILFLLSFILFGLKSPDTKEKALVEQDSQLNDVEASRHSYTLLYGASFMNFMAFLHMNLFNPFPLGWILALPISCIVMALIGFIVYYFTSKPEDHENIQKLGINLKFALLATVLIVSVNGVALEALLKASYVTIWPKRKGGLREIISFKFEEKVIKSDSSNFYLGGTENYLFIYNMPTNTTNVYPRSDIKQLSFTRQTVK